MKDKSKSNNFVGDIHNKDYQDAYRINEFTNRDMIFDSGRPRESLNGLWNFGIDQYDTCLRAKWFEEKYKNKEGMVLPVDFSFEQWERMKVPSCWNTEEERYLLYEGSAVYTRTFRYSNIGEGRVFIKFGAANYEAKVFLNKKYLGFHKGGSTPFYVEVTGKLEEVNRILVVVNNTRKSTSVPCENTDWFNYGGLYRDIEILRMPETFIKDFYIRLMPGSNFEKIRADVIVYGSIQNGKALLEIEELNIIKEIALEDSSGFIEFEARPELWCPENPKLYTVKVSFCEDSICDKIGFREVKTEGTDIILNGQKIFLKGISCHEESVDNGKAISEEEIIHNIKLAKEMNCNFMRLAHYPHTEKSAKLADEMGIMLWEEIPVYWAIDFENQDTYKDAENQLSELMIRDRNRASVIIWSIGNENADTDARLKFMKSLAEKAKDMDPTRLLSAACMVDHEENKINDRLAEFLDIIGINEYCGWYTPDFERLPELFQNSRPGKPVIISEFGADARAGHRGSIDDLGSEDCQENVYKRQVETLRKIPYIKGISPWILYDFRCPRRLHYLQNYYNTKGLLSANKKHKKLAFYVMQKFYSEK